MFTQTVNKMWAYLVPGSMAWVRAHGILDEERW